MFVTHRQRGSFTCDTGLFDCQTAILITDPENVRTRALVRVCVCMCVTRKCVCVCVSVCCVCVRVLASESKRFMLENKDTLTAKVHTHVYVCI